MAESKIAQQAEEIRLLEERLGQGSPFPNSPQEASAQSRAALQAVADTNSRLQSQVATLTEQRETISEGLRMVQAELDSEHEVRQSLESEVDALRARLVGAPEALQATMDARVLEQERDDAVVEFDRLSEEHEELESRYRSAMVDHELALASLQARNDELENALKAHQVRPMAP